MNAILRKSKYQTRNVLERLRLVPPRCFVPYYDGAIKRQEFKVIFTAPIYGCYPIVVHALRAQSYRNWELLLIHDGPDLENVSGLIEQLKDSRIKFFSTEERHGNWGHALRELALKKIAEGISGDFVVMTNADNYHVPGFTEKMLQAFRPGVGLVYCDMVTDLYQWNLVNTALERSKIDCGCLMVRREIALDIGWRWRNYEADWEFVEEALNRYGSRSFAKICSPLFVHN